MEHRTTRPQAALSARRIWRSVAALAVLARLAGAPVLAQTGPAQVDQVIDGDTISVRRDGLAALSCMFTARHPGARRAPGAMGRPGKESMMTKEIADAGTRSTKAGKALDRMHARAVKADEARTEAAHHARAAQVVTAAADAWDTLATQAAAHADQYRRGAELADRTRHRWAR